MATLTVTDRGEVTFDHDVMEHLGIRPGEKVKLVLLPGGRAELTADKASPSWDDLLGFLDGKTNGARLTIEDINEAIASASAKAGMSGLKGR